ncbi:MAG: ATPase [Bacteroidetes bacterium]|nr:ATPase [Bacteroidota bacterium]MBK8657698.1 ATPase [Bacteroidota bacterium]
MARKQFTLEYIIHSSPAILFEFLAQPTNLAQWFSDYCDSQGDIFIFGWGGEFKRARQVELEDEDFVKYHWEDSNKGEYFSFKVYKSEISNETVLEVTDFAEQKEIKEQTFLWDKQIEDLKHALGAY